MRNRTENQIDFYIIRHGMTPANEEHRYLGRTDESLSQQGIRQLRAAVWSTLVSPEFVLVSPMRRCRESAKLLFVNVPMLVIPEWREMDFGEFEGKNYEELNGNPRYQSWIDSGGRTAFPGGESRDEFAERVVAGMEKAVGYLHNQLEQKACARCGAGGSMCVAAVVHGGTIMALLDHYGEGDYYDYQVTNGKGFRCHLTLGGKEIQFRIVGKL